MSYDPSEESSGVFEQNVEGWNGAPQTIYSDHFLETHADLSVQLQHNGGNSFSEYGALPQRQMVQAMLTYYF